MAISDKIVSMINDKQDRDTIISMLIMMMICELAGGPAGMAIMAAQLVSTMGIDYLNPLGLVTNVDRSFIDTIMSKSYQTVVSQTLEKYGADIESKIQEIEQKSGTKFTAEEVTNIKNAIVSGYTQAFVYFESPSSPVNNMCFLGATPDNPIPSYQGPPSATCNSSAYAKGYYDYFAKYYQSYKDLNIINSSYFGSRMLDSGTVKADEQKAQYTILLTGIVFVIVAIIVAFILL